MTKQDYELIAQCIKDQLAVFRDSEAIKSVADDLAYRLGQENPRFDEHRFLKACGVR